MCSKNLKTHLLNLRTSYTTGLAVFIERQNIDENILNKSNLNISPRFVDVEGPEGTRSPHFFAKQNKKFNAHCVYLLVLPVTSDNIIFYKCTQNHFNYSTDLFLLISFFLYLTLRRDRVFF